MIESERRRTAMDLVRRAHRWLGLALLLLLVTGTVLAVPVVNADGRLSAPAAVLEVFRWEAAGGGMANEPGTLALMSAMAVLGVTLLLDRFVRPHRRAGGLPRAWRGWVRLAHRWLGVAFTVSLVAYLLVRALGEPSVTLGWAWLSLLFAVNCLGCALLVLHLLRAARRRRQPDPTSAVRAAPRTG